MGRVQLAFAYDVDLSMLGVRRQQIVGQPDLAALFHRPGNVGDKVIGSPLD